MGQAGGPRQWSIPKRTGRASGTGEGDWQGSSGAGRQEAKAGRQDGSEAARIRQLLCLPF